MIEAEKRVKMIFLKKLNNQKFNKKLIFFNKTFKMKITKL